MSRTELSMTIGGGDPPAFATADRLMRAAWADLDGGADGVDLVRFTGDPTGLLASRLAALPAALASVSAATLAASILDGARTGADPAPINIDAEHTAAACTSERYARHDGIEGAIGFAPLSRFWRTADGWLRLHANYPWHRDRALQVLGCRDEEDRVEAAVLGWPGADLEDALAAAGGVGYAVRERRAWLEHPQGAVVAPLPLVEITPSPSGPRAGGALLRAAGAARAAAGFRVLDLTRVIAGPVATRTLAAWGAQVLRLDSPELPEIPAQAVDTLSGKRSASLNLSTSTGRDHMEHLLGQADVLVQGYRPGALARFGLDPDALADRHPHLTVVTLSAWGGRGPWSGRRGFDSVVQCPTGIAAAEGSPADPGTLPAQILDHATGYLAAAAAMHSLASVIQGGPPRSARLSLAQTAHWLTAAGPFQPEPARRIPAKGFMVTLPGASAPVHVVSPPGASGDLHPAWTATTDLGADRPEFLTVPASP